MGVERIDTVPGCPYCESDDLVRIDKYDAVACRSCRRWVEERCSGPACEYCSIRPETADSVDWDDKWNT